MSYHSSITLLRTFVRYVSECGAHWSGERGRANSNKRQKRSAQVDILCFFFAALRDGGLLEMSCFFINGVVDSTSGERFLTITFRISPVKYHVYLLVVCFFPRLPQ